MAVLLGGNDDLILQGISGWTRENGWLLDTTLLTATVLPEIHPWDGVLVIANSIPVANWLGTVKCPVVKMQHTYPLSESARLSGLPQVNCDYDEIGRMGAEHLLELGKPSFVFYRRHRDEYARAMEKGFIAAMGAAGQEAVVFDFLGDYPDISEDDSVPLELRVRWLVEKMAQIETPMALMAEDDRYAIDAVYAAHRMGLRVPEDVAILGVDDKSSILEVSDVAISSIDTNLRGVGREAAALLALLVAGGDPPASPLFVAPNRVMARISTATYAGSHRLADEALRYVRRNFHSHELTFESVAKRLRVTPFGLRKILLRETGGSLSQEILRLRMNAAMHLMAETSLKLESIAHEAGFGSGNHFYRVFKKVVGISPQDWRRSLEADPPMQRPSS